MIVLKLDPLAFNSLMEACIEIDESKFLSILRRSQNNIIELDKKEIPVAIDYLTKIEDHLSNKFPHYDDEEAMYNECDENGYFNGLETYRHPLVYELAAVLGDDFLTRYVKK